jgi:hypothetical protein
VEADAGGWQHSMTSHQALDNDPDTRVQAAAQASRMRASGNSNGVPRGGQGAAPGMSQQPHRSGRHVSQGPALDERPLTSLAASLLGPRSRVWAVKPASMQQPPAGWAPTLDGVRRGPDDKAHAVGQLAAEGRFADAVAALKHLVVAAATPGDSGEAAAADLQRCAGGQMCFLSEGWVGGTPSHHANASTAGSLTQPLAG